MPEFVFINGQRVTPWMLWNLQRLDTALRSNFGVGLKVMSAIRLHQEQINVFLARYVTAGNINGRRVYDTRYWNGTRYYRVSPAGTVAAPGFSNHEVQGDKAAVDIQDTGADSGIMNRNSRRGQWLRQQASEFGLVAEGDGFGEGWHFAMPGYNRPVPAAPASGGSGVSKETRARQQWLNSRFKAGLLDDGRQGPRTTAWYKKYQEFLKLNWGYTGLIDGEWGPKMQAAHQRYWNAANKPKPKPPTPKPKPKPQPKPKKFNPFGIPSAAGLQKVARLHGYGGIIDDQWGPNSASGFAAFLRKNWGYSGDNNLGPRMWASIARWLRARYGYVGNDTPGPNMRAALKRANDKNYAELR